MSGFSQTSVTEFFDREASQGRLLLPDRSGVSGFGTYRKYQKAAAMMAEEKVERVLDVGCNRGSIEALFQSLYPEAVSTTRIDGIDVSSRAIAQALELSLPNCRFQTYSGTEIPFPVASFDLVVLVEVLEHVPAKRDLLREIWRVLKPGGRLYLTTPNPNSLALRIELRMWRILRRLFRRPPIAKDEFIRHDELADMMASIGFRQPVREPLFDWPRPYLYFLGWGLLPPLPPRLLLRYQKFCAARLETKRIPAWLSSRISWTLAGTFVKPEA